MKTKMMALALVTMAGTAIAQPAVFTDLGDRTSTQTFTQPVTLLAANDIQWFKMSLPAVSAAAGWVDIWTSAPGDMTDTEIGLYTSTGVGAGTATTFFDDDSGAGNLSQLTFGSTTARPLIPGSAARNGSDGTLDGGDYYLAVGRFNVTFVNSNFNATSTYALAERTTTLNFDIRNPNGPFPPSGVGAAAPAAATAGFPVLFTVTVTPGGNPENTVFTVSTDLSSIGGSATQQFFDNGTNGDVTAGDSIFSYSYTVPGATAENSYTLPFTVTDGLSRSGNGSIAISVDSAGATLETAFVPSGSGELALLAGNLVANDVDIFKINICDLANFSATTFGNGNTADTRLFLFSPDGMGVTYNDDVPAGFPGDATLQSRISNANVAATGDYYLAVTRYQIMASDAGGNNLWVTGTPFDVEIAPNGAGAANPLAQWTGAAVTQTAVTYTVALTGACYPGAGPTQCSAADVGMAGGEPGQDNLLDNNDFIAFINFFFEQNPIADQGQAGGEYGSDGLYDNNDFIAFINHFFEDAANCNG